MSPVPQAGVGQPATVDTGPAADHGLDLRLAAAAAVAWAVTLVELRLTATVSVGVAIVALAAAVGLIRRSAAHRAPVAADGSDASEAGAVPRWRVTLALSTAFVALVSVATAGQLLTRQAGTVDELAAARATVRIEGVITSDPRPVAAGLHGRSRLVLTTMSVRQVVGRARRSTPRTPVLVLGDERWLAVHWHERVAVAGRLRSADRGQDVEAVLFARGAPRVVAGAGVVLDAVETVRRDTRSATGGLPADARGLVPALVIGDTSRLPSRLDDDMRATGMTHLNAVSGSNVTMVLLAAMWLAGLVGLSGRRRLVAVGIVLGLFVLLCRPEPSVVRAAVMGAIGLLGMSASRRASGPPVLAAAVVVLLVLDPWLAASYGFALSSLATLGLLLFARPWSEVIARFLPTRLHAAGEAIAIPMAAQAMCAPVIVLLQGSVSLIGIPANVLAAPLVAPATFAGIATVLASSVSVPAARLPAWCAAVPAQGIAVIAHAGAAFPLGTLPWPDGAFGAVLLAALTVLVLCAGLWLVRTMWARPYLAAAGAVLVAAIWAPPPMTGWPPKGWVYVACDVGQGDGGVLAAAPGHVVMVDAGPEPDSMATCLRRLRVRSVDAVVLTHFHADHVDGLAGVLHAYRPAAIYVTPAAGGQDTDSEASQEPLVRRLATPLGVPLRTLQAGDELDLGQVHAAVLAPTRLIRAGSVQNNASIVLDVRSGGLRLLLTGDIEKEAAATLLGRLRASPAAPPIDVLKVPHHGSANQDPALERAVHAPIAVISVGAHNDYGHPSPRTLDLLRDSGSTVERTDRGGDIAVVAREGRAFIARP